MNKFLPDVVDVEEIKSLELSEIDSLLLPDQSVEDVTILEIESHYRKIMNRGALYFCGFESLPADQSGLNNPSAESPNVDLPSSALVDRKYSFFVTGSYRDQFETIAFKVGGVLYKLNDDYYIVRSSDTAFLKSFDVSSVYVSNIPSDVFKSIAALYDLKVESNSVQFVVRGPFLSQLDFSRVLKVLNDKHNIYLVDLAFIDFTVDESANFEAFLAAKPTDFLFTQNINDLFALYLDCSVDSLRNRDYFSQSLLAADGKSSVFDVGNTHSREQRAISDQGTSTVSSYNDISDGFKLSFKPSFSAGDSVVCSIELENSAFKDDNYSTKSETTLNIESVSLQLGKTYYLSSFTNLAKRRSLYLFGLDLARADRVNTCWIRVRKVR